VIHLTHPQARAVYGTGNVLVRPDQHVAWRGTALPDAGAGAVLDRVLGGGGHHDTGLPGLVAVGSAGP
jgi:hypothetical protein